MRGERETTTVRRFLPTVGRSLLALALLVGSPSAARAQDEEGEGPDLRPFGLLRTGLRLESDDAGGRDAFVIYDARLGVEGKVGIVFDYSVQIEADTDDEDLRLLDAALSVPLRSEYLRLDLGLVKSPFGYEALLEKGDLQLVERSQATLAMAPGRQVGLRLGGNALEGRLRYWGGAFNGNGARFDNDDGDFLWAARVEYNTVGEVEFFEDLVVQVGTDVAYSQDSSLAVVPVLVDGGPAGPPRYALAPFTGSRFLWSADAQFRYLNYSLSAEYLRAEYDLEGGEEVTAEGFTLEGGYTLWGAFDFLLRYDAFEPAATVGDVPDDTKFLVLGLNVRPGFSARVGLQFAIGLDGSKLGPDEAIDGTNSGPGLADKQFLLNLQLAF